MDVCNQADLRTLLQRWTEERRQAFQDRMAQAWQEARERFQPDDELVEGIRAWVEAAVATAAAEEPTKPEADFPPWSPPEIVEDHSDEDLGAGLDLLAETATQGETLKALLETTLRCAGRSALFVIKQGIATLYAHRGFEADQPRLGVPVVPPPELEELIQGRTGMIEDPGPAYQALLAALGPDAAAAARIIPLRLRRRTVALLLVDSGVEDRLERPNHLRALALGAEARLSYLAGAREEERGAQAEAHPSVLTQRIPDPIAEHAPALDPTVRSNAERSARVLVGDIELYFPAKVAQGQSQGNLYVAMKDELDRSRASFVERYGTELENQHRIFYKTVVQQLCAGDPTRLGPAPWATR